MSEVQTIDLEYVPRPPQRMLHLRTARFLIVVSHRRMGKTIFLIMELLNALLTLKLKRPRFAYLAPTYAQAKRVAWDELVERCRKIPNVKVNQKELTVSIDRPWMDDTGKIMLLGAENPDSLRGIYLDGAVLDEYGSMSSLVLPEVIYRSGILSRG